MLQLTQNLVGFLLIFLQICPPVTLPVTHWTRDLSGKITPITDSYFAMKDGGEDLSSLLQQLSDFDELKRLKSQLIKQRSEIETNPDIKKTREQTHDLIEHEHYRENENCEKAVKRLDEMNYHIPLAITHYIPLKTITETGIKPIWNSREDCVDKNNCDNKFDPEKSGNLLPYCHIIADYPLKNAPTLDENDEVMQQVKYAYEHVRRIRNTEMPPYKQFIDDALLSVARGLGMDTTYPIEHLAHSLTYAITQETPTPFTWVLFDIAALFWRVQDKPKLALECLERSYIYANWELAEIPQLFPKFQISQVILFDSQLAHPYGYVYTHMEDYSIATNATKMMKEVSESADKHLDKHPSDFFNIVKYALGNFYIHIQSQNKALALFNSVDLDAKRGPIKYHYDIQKKISALICGIELLKKLDDQKASLENTLTILQKYKMDYTRLVEGATQIRKKKVSKKEQMNSHVSYLKSTHQQAFKVSNIVNNCETKYNKFNEPYKVCKHDFNINDGGVLSDDSGFGGIGEHSEDELNFKYELKLDSDGTLHAQSDVKNTNSCDGGVSIDVASQTCSKPMKKESVKSGKILDKEVIAARNSKTGEKSDQIVTEILNQVGKTVKPISESDNSTDESEIVFESETDSDEESDLKFDSNSDSDSETTEDSSDYYDWRLHAWPGLSECTTLFGTTHPMIDKFPSAVVDVEKRGYKPSTIFADSDDYVLKPDYEDLDVIGTPMPYCHTIVDIDSFEEEDIMVRYSQLNGITEGLVLPGFEEIRLLPENSKMNSRLQLWTNQNLWMIDKLLKVMLNEDGKAWSGQIGPRLAWALQESWGQYLENKGEYKDDPWYVLNMAAIFWRIHGGPNEALKCLLRSAAIAPKEYRDVPLVQLADFIYRAGYVTEAFHVLRDALDINQLEPAIYLAMGNALQAANNYTGAVEFYNFAMYLKPTYVEAFHSLSIVKCQMVRQNKQPESAKSSKFNFYEALEAASMWYKDHEKWMQVASNKLFSENTLIDFKSGQGDDMLDQYAVYLDENGYENRHRYGHIKETNDQSFHEKSVEIIDINSEAYLNRRGPKPTKEEVMKNGPIETRTVSMDADFDGEGVTIESEQKGVKNSELFKMKPKTLQFKTKSTGSMTLGDGDDESLLGMNSKTAKLSIEAKRKIMKAHIKKFGDSKDISMSKEQRAKHVKNSMMDTLVVQLNDRKCTKLLDNPESNFEKFLKVKIDEVDQEIVHFSFEQSFASPMTGTVYEIDSESSKEYFKTEPDPVLPILNQQSTKKDYESYEDAKTRASCKPEWKRIQLEFPVNKLSQHTLFLIRMYNSLVGTWKLQQEFGQRSGSNRVEFPVFAENSDETNRNYGFRNLIQILAMEGNFKDRNWGFDKQIQEAVLPKSNIFAEKWWNYLKKSFYYRWISIKPTEENFVESVCCLLSAAHHNPRFQIDALYYEFTELALSVELHHVAMEMANQAHSINNERALHLFHMAEVSLAKSSGVKISSVINSSLKMAEKLLEKAVRADESFEKAVKTLHKVMCVKRLFYPVESDGPVKRDFLKFDLKLSDKAIDAWSANEEQISNWDWGGAIEAIEERGV